MTKRWVVIWFYYLRTDWFIRRDPSLKDSCFVLALPDHGRMMITAASKNAEAAGLRVGMTVADAKVIVPSLKVLDDDPELSSRLLKRIAEWCIRYSPAVAIDSPQGLIIDASGCTHLWGGEERYLQDIAWRFEQLGYHLRLGMADTIGAAWAMAHYSKENIIGTGEQDQQLVPLPPAALRIDPKIVLLLQKLGLDTVGSFLAMPRSALRRRFGKGLIDRIDQALGNVDEIIEPVQPPEPWQQRLPSPEPIITAKGIEIAITRLLGTICAKLKEEQKGLRLASFSCYRTDGTLQTINIGTNRPSNDPSHLFKLFEIKINSIAPGPGIELFVLDAKRTGDISIIQEKLWQASAGLYSRSLSELLDRLAGRIGEDHVRRFLPAEHYLPEHSIKKAGSLDEQKTIDWNKTRPRPLQLLSIPELIEVTAPIPDYPPMGFRYKGQWHKIIKADGPERIEQEWWVKDGPHRDYYYVENEEGERYWLFRSGHYSADRRHRWYLHGFFG